MKYLEKLFVLEYYDVSEDFWVFVMLYMCIDFVCFCILEVFSYFFSVDFIFNFREFEVIFYSYKYLLLKCKRTNELFLFVGLIVIYYFKIKVIYKKVVLVVVVNFSDLVAKEKGFITDGE